MLKWVQMAHTLYSNFLLRIIFNLRFGLKKTLKNWIKNILTTKTFATFIDSLNFVLNPPWVVLTECENEPQQKTYKCIKTETSKLQIMKISVNPKPHLEKKTPTTGLSSTVSAAQYGKWGVGGCVTFRPINNSLRAQRAPPASPCAWLRLDRSPSFSHTQKEVARRVWTGGGGERNTASQMGVVFLERSTVYSPSGLTTSVTW